MTENKFSKPSSLLCRIASLTLWPLFGSGNSELCSQVQKGGPAALAGLEDEDVIIEVNGVNMLDAPYENVVDRIQSSGKTITLLVCGKKAYDYFQAKKIPIVSSMADPLDDDPDPDEGRLEESEQDSHTADERERVSGDTLLLVI